MRSVTHSVAAKASVVLLLAGGPVGMAAARDFWLEPAKLLPTKGEELVVKLEAGDSIRREEELPLQKDRVTRFDCYGDRVARRDLLAAGQEEQSPAARLRLDSGSALIVMDRKPRQAVLEADQFNRYLEDEGQEAVLAQRVRSGQTENEGRETYTRFLKTLVQERNLATATANTLYKRRVGQRLELLLEADPGSLAPDGALAVKVLFEGNPVAGLKVSAWCTASDGSPHVFSAVTTQKGLAQFKLDQPGLWLVRTVYARASDGAPRPETPWESFWATYTFAVRYAPAPVPTPSLAASPAKP